MMSFCPFNTFKELPWPHLLLPIYSFEPLNLTNSVTCQFFFSTTCPHYLWAILAYHRCHLSVDLFLIFAICHAVISNIEKSFANALPSGGSKATSKTSIWLQQMIWLHWNSKPDKPILTAIFDAILARMQTHTNIHHIKSFSKKKCH